MKSIRVDVQWVLVREEDGSPYHFPDRLSSFVRKNYCHPVIYRWRLSPPDTAQAEAVYVGETEDLAKRVQGVRAPGKSDAGASRTNTRLRKEFDERLAKGSGILLEIVDLEDFEFNGVVLGKRHLHDHFHRCALENLLLLLELGAGHEVLNRLVTFEDKAVRLVSKNFPNAQPEEKVRTAIHEFLSKRGQS